MASMSFCLFWLNHFSKKQRSAMYKGTRAYIGLKTHLFFFSIFLAFYMLTIDGKKYTIPKVGQSNCFFCSGQKIMEFPFIGSMIYYVSPGLH